MDHIRHAAVGTAMTLLYGHPRGPTRDKFIHLAEQATESLVEAGNFGDHFVDVMPILKYVPEWVPGAGFQKQARIWKGLCDSFRTVPFEDVKRRVAEGTVTQCLVARLLEIRERSEDPDMDEYLIKSTAGVIYLGGADTTLSTLYSFILAMVLYPDVQSRAQREIDAICHMQRLPTFSDRDSMPYVNGIVTELYRWNPTVPLGVPHRLEKEDVYEGMTIPKGSTIMINAWSILHDPEMYANPFEFDPSRYLSSPSAKGKECEGEEEVMDPRNIAFGFGRRLCPGRYLGDATVWLTVVSVLASFRITPLEPDGKKMEYDYSTGLVSRPMPFNCQIQPRSAEVKNLIEVSLEA